ncbi:MAG: hypothetical protein ACRDOG_00475 [Gaiellaceae bacterium]
MSDDPRSPARKRQIARNEALFREVNERIREISASEAGTIDFLCECGDSECTSAVPLTEAEYQRVRAEPDLFVVRPGHEIENVEELVGRNERFSVVRKHVGEAAVAREFDPRR